MGNCVYSGRNNRLMDSGRLDAFEGCPVGFGSLPIPREAPSPSLPPALGGLFRAKQHSLVKMPAACRSEDFSR